MIRIEIDLSSSTGMNRVAEAAEYIASQLKADAVNAVIHRITVEEVDA